MKRYKLCSSEAVLQRPRGKLNYSNGFTHFFTSFAFKLGLNFESLIVCILLLILTAIKQSARRFGSWLILCYTKGKEKSSCLHKFENINQNQLCSCALQFSWKSVISCTTSSLPDPRASNLTLYTHLVQFCFTVMTIQFYHGQNTHAKGNSGVTVWDISV